jgi:hypothetical protein
MDFGRFGDPNGITGQQNNTTNQSGPPAGGQPGFGGVNSTQQGNNVGASSAPREQEGIFMHTMEHPGVSCDGCEGTIRGFRVSLILNLL